MTDGIRYIGKGEFIVTEEWLREVYGLAVEMKIGNWLGVDNWSGWWDTHEAIEELYPDYYKDYDCPQDVTEAIIYDWMNKS
nr:MAG TPA: hypothetical protein [Caudoviricetes sp.]